VCIGGDGRDRNHTTFAKQIATTGEVMMMELHSVIIIIIIIKVKIYIKTFILFLNSMKYFKHT